jgi:GTP-binding protein
MNSRPIIAVVGSPNAGKSTLINRLSGTRSAVVHETPGVTRDRKVVPVEWAGSQLDVVDTGGFQTADDAPFAAEIRQQVLAAVEHADLVLFVVDARSGPLPGDYAIAEVLRRVNVPVILVANKVDNPERIGADADLYELGIGEPVPISSLHGTGTGDLLDLVVNKVAHVPRTEDADEEDALAAPLPVVIVGRPNAGKSSLFNAVTGEPRTIVSDLPGTTRDSIDTTVENQHGRFLFVDTAGMRKAAKVSGVEYYSYLRSLQSLDRAHVAVIVADATVGIGELDITIAAEAAKRSCATVIAFNKWDVEQPLLEDARGLTDRKLRQRPAVLPVSALTGRGVGDLLDLLVRLGALYTYHVPTPVLNRALATIVAGRPSPQKGGRRLKTYYIAQFGTAPPRFAIGVNDRTLVTRDYGFYIENRLRAEYGMQGVPLIIDFKSS